MKYALKELRTFEEMAACYHLLQQLNPHLLQEDYETMLRDMIPANYGQVVVLDGDKVVAVSGFWIATKIYSGKYIEMDNVVTDAAYRGKGIGKLLVDWICQRGAEAGCVMMMLDAYAANKEAHRFYYREGFHIAGFHFLKQIKR
ncbi:GNAT family N-acetyltransferase [Chitinophaga lutea]